MKGLEHGLFQIPYGCLKNSLEGAKTFACFILPTKALRGRSFQ
jgi:hypothetical protein